MKDQIQRRLIANILEEKCAENSALLFRDAWCTVDRIIRFTTPLFRTLFPSSSEEKGGGARYELENNLQSAVVRCVIELAMLTQEGLAAAKQLSSSSAKNGLLILKQWDITPADGKLDTLFTNFDSFLEKTLPAFETALKEKLSVSEPEPLTEGEQIQAVSQKYERNKKAREACLAAHGTACAVCGIDFARAYGPEFAGKIEVHHIVPLSEIGESYTVDPVQDLVPVCPNCHTALHSKKDGVYTVEELKNIRKGN